MDRLTRRVAQRYAGQVVPIGVRPKGPTLTISGRKYVLSPHWPWGESLTEEGDEPPKPGMGARVIQVGDPKKARYLWAFNIDKKVVAMWQAAEGNEKAYGSSQHFMRDVMFLDKQGQMNRVTDAEFRNIDRYMRRRADESLKALKQWAEQMADAWDRQAKRMVQEYFDKDVLPKVQAKWQEVKQGVIPLGFKVNERIVQHRPAEDQKRIFVMEQVFKQVFQLDDVHAHFKSKGIDPYEPPGNGDMQAVDWAYRDVLEEFYDKQFR